MKAGTARMLGCHGPRLDIAVHGISLDCMH